MPPPLTAFARAPLAAAAGTAALVGGAVRRGVRTVEEGARAIDALVGEVVARAEDGVVGGAAPSDGAGRGPQGFVRDALADGRLLVREGLGRNRRATVFGADPAARHAEIEVRGVRDAAARALRRSLKDELEGRPGVAWAEVNAITGHVAVAFDARRVPLDALVGVVEAVERAAGVAPQADPTDVPWDAPRRADHPADVEPVLRTIAAVAGQGVALVWTVVGRLTALPSLPVEVAGLVGVVDNQPLLRRRVEAVLGRRATDLVLPLVAAGANGVGQGPAGIVVDGALQVALYGELRARRQVWARREHDMYAVPRPVPVEPPAIGPRPRPIPDGPVEQAGRRLPVAAGGAVGAVLLAIRDLRRAADAVLLGAPKAARFGREAFAARLGRELAARGVVPLDGSALRRLDRVDTVVLDAQVLGTGRFRVEDVVPLARGPSRPTAVGPGGAGADATGGRPDGGHGDVLGGLPGRVMGRHGSVQGRRVRLRPLDGTWLDARGRALAGEVGRPGRPAMGVEVEGERIGVAAVSPEPVPGAGELVRAVRTAGHRLVVADDSGVVAAAWEADAVPRGRPLGAAVRALQDEGAVVALVAERGKSGLVAADVGIGLRRANGRAPWGADLVCDAGLEQAAFVVSATGAAADVSRRGAWLAYGGAAAGVAVALAAPPPRAAARALLMANGAAAMALVDGTWTAAQLARRPVRRQPEAADWHARTVTETLDALGSRPEGLTAGEAQERFEASQVDAPAPSRVEPFLAELANPFTPVLAAGAGLAAAVGSVTDAVLVGGLVGVNTVVGGVRRLRTDAAVGRLLERTAAPVVVVRDGGEHEHDRDAVVRGDVVRLRAGDLVPADCRILDAEGLEVDESALTGESFPVAKSSEPSTAGDLADRHSMLYDGTSVLAGQARAVVVEHGDTTELGRTVAGAADGAPVTGVEARLAEVARRMLPVAALSGVATAGIGLLRRWPAPEIVGTGVGLALASVPEGLPFVASAAQLAAARRLAARGALVRNPRTIEALGRADVLCFDKTGTLTEGEVRLCEVHDLAAAADVHDLGDSHRAVVDVALAATPGREEDRRSIDRALVASHAVAGDGRAADRAVADLAFEANRAFHAVLRDGRDGRWLAVKGAPEAVVPRCTAARAHGRSEPIDPGEVAGRVEELATAGYRVLAVAEGAAGVDDLGEDDVRDLALVGLLAFAEAVRPTAADAVARVRAAGVQVAMLTGDHPTTARAVADDLGILDGGRVVTGTEIDELDDARLDERIARATVFARVTPQQKVRIVQSYQRLGRVVAMTGDGANDAPAIRLAEVGIALGRRGSPAAREAADLVVTDDHLETIVEAIAEGRALWASVREGLAILLGGNLGEMGYTVAASALAPAPPLNARQLLLMNLLTDLGPALAVAVRPPVDSDPETLLREGPEASLSGPLSRAVGVRAVATGGAATVAWTAARLTGRAQRANTVGLVALVGTQLGQTVVFGGWRNPLVLATAAGSWAALTAAVQLPGLSRFFGCRPLGPVGWAQATLAAAGGTAASWVAARTLEAGGAAGAGGDGAQEGEGDRDRRVVDLAAAERGGPAAPAEQPGRDREPAVRDAAGTATGRSTGTDATAP